MRSLILSVAILHVCATVSTAQNIAINTDGALPHASAALDIKSTDKGLLVPRLTTAQRTAIASPAKGLLVFDTDVNSFWFFNGASWNNLAGSSFAIPYAAVADNADSVFSITNTGKGITGNFKLYNTYAISSALKGEINSMFANFGTAGVYGLASGTGGYGGLFHASNVNGSGSGLMAYAQGDGNGIRAITEKAGDAVQAFADGSGNAVYASLGYTGTGKAGVFENKNKNNTQDLITATTTGNGTAGNFKVDNTYATSAAVKGEVNSIFSNFGTAGVYGLSSGTGGYAGLFYNSNTSNTISALIAMTAGTGNAITASASQTGDGLNATVESTGTAIHGWIPNYGTGKAAVFENKNTSNTQPIVQVINAGQGYAFQVNHTGSAGNIASFQAKGVNVSRIDRNGKGFFNGGTQTSGADLAEAFDVTGDVTNYQPGDVLVIATGKDRAVEKSSTPYSTLVAGVYATKPGVLLTEENIDNKLEDKVPMGVVGVIPTRVCLEGGAIKRGDMLVTSSKTGVAMKADIDKIKPGQVIGKALQNFNDLNIGKINVLVNVK
ncbi:MAG: hypothetical protein QM731_16090 [Chitinophagaceae bacterium]